MSDKREEELFQTFRPFCSALATKPSMAILEKLQELVHRAQDLQGLTEIQEYIIFPMQLYLKTPTMPENYTLAVFNFVAMFYSKVELRSKFVLKDMIENTLTLIMKLDKPSEDFKISFAKMLTSLFKSTKEFDIKKYVYEEDLKLPLSHIIFQLLDWTENEEARIVIFASLETIDALVLDPEKSEKNHVEVQEAYIERMAPMLPGTTTKIVKLLKRNFPSQGHKIKTKCLDLWTKLVTSIISDANVQLEPTMRTSPGAKFLSDPQWITNAGNHLFQHVQIFLGMVLHPQVTVRHALQRMCSKLQRYSWKSLGNTRVLQIEIISLLSVDHDDVTLRNSSQNTLKNLLLQLENDKKDDVHSGPPMWVVDLAQSKIFETSKLLCDSGYIENLFHESKTLEKHLATVHGFLWLLKSIERASHFFYSKTYTSTLLDALIVTVTLQKKSLISEAAFLNLKDCQFFFDPELYLASARPEKKFRHLTTTELLWRLDQIAQLMASFGQIEAVINYLKNIFDRDKHPLCDGGDLDEQQQQPREAIYLLNIMIRHGFGDENQIFLMELAEVYLDLILQTSSSSSSGHENSNFTKNPLAPYSSSSNQFSSTNKKEIVEDLEWNQRLLLMEGLSCIAQTLAKASNGELIRIFDRDNTGRTLVNVLIFVNVSLSHQAHVAYFVLNDLTKAIGYKNITSLLETHLEYMSRQLTLLLRKHFMRNDLERPQGLSNLLRIVLKLKKDDKSVRDVINTLLRQLDLSWMDADLSLTTEILKIVCIFVSNLDIEYQQNELKNTEKKEEKGRITKLIKALLYKDKMEKKALADEDIDHIPCPEVGFHDEKFRENDSEENDDDGLSNNDSPETEVPDKIKFLRETIKHCRHFISMVAVPQWQLLAMEIVGISIIGLKMEENEVLPLVHQTWQPLKLLFTSNNLFVVEKAFGVLKILANCAKDFIRKRTIEDVFPALASYLRKLQVMVEDRSLQQTMAARQSRKMLRDMTSGLWDFMALLDLNEAEVDPIVDHMIQFVEFSQSNPQLIYNSSTSNPSTGTVQSNVDTYYEPVRKMDADILWMKTRQLHSCKTT